MAKKKNAAKTHKPAGNKNDNKTGKAENKAAKKTKKQEPQQAAPWELAYERGNYAAARRLAKQAVQGEHAQSAQAVLDKISVDKAPLIVFAVCLALISTIAYLGLG